MSVLQLRVETDRGKPGHAAVIDSVISRARPVMMGTLTTVLGVAPLFFDAFFQSMAVVLVFGLSFATVRLYQHDFSRGAAVLDRPATGAPMAPRVQHRRPARRQ